ncbi:uncharacterized protein LOC127278532 [Leptopilina boulardi]|uniref:uncharacterized protein LOC127278532 n=1 Tax=Leptopilina boulardi TaxID=63433 RepID=UPI0021F5F90B|nr:uncharacterized protein LOC127278532 [Leptopilina boulardi]XP_051156239.1 uncharacterized protein LOC127278532 [Leptopilina boulardi]
MAIARIKSFLDTSIKNVSAPLERTVHLEPEIGLRIEHSQNLKTLSVTVLGARHLPQTFGFTRVNSYLVKVKLLPGKEKYETTTKNESWPQWNEEFVFNLRKETKSKFGKTKVVDEELGGSRFIVATLYAILEDKPLVATEKKENEEKTKTKEKNSLTKKSGKKKEDNCGSSTTQDSNKNKFFSQIFSKTTDKVADQNSPERKIFDKRRVIGATNVPLDSRNFITKPIKAKHQNDVSTGDMWRTLKAISSGITGAEDRRENKKGQVEISLCQEKSDKKDGSGESLVLTLLRLRCSMQTMHEHEMLRGQMYIKMSVIEGGKVTHFWKSNRFTPCISLKFAPEMAKVIAENPYEGALKDVSFVIKFISKNKLGKKTTVGHFAIGPEVGGTYSDQWKQALAKPGNQIIKWQSFE